VAQTAFSAVLMRGGTSKGLFFRGGVLPDDPEIRDRILLRALGSPDPFRRQVDGLGGATPSTSKAAIVSASSNPDGDVDYLFAQVGVERSVVDYSGNCGNLSSAVGPFAIEEGLVSAEPDGEAAVRIWQVNTGKRIIARVPVRGGRPLVEGSDVIDGVPRAGSEISVEFLEPGGSACGGLLPTTRALDRLDIPGCGWMDVTLLDAGTPAVFVRASDLGLNGTELPETVDGNADLLARLEAIRSRAAVAMGLAANSAEATARRPETPKIVMVAPPRSYFNIRAAWVPAESCDLVARIVSMGRLHHAFAVTGGIATAIAAAVPGTIPNAAAGLRREGEHRVRIGHPAGTMAVGVTVSRRGETWFAEKAVVGRTARRLMEGRIWVPVSVVRGERRVFPVPAYPVRPAGRADVQIRIPAVLMRGGTSRGLFFRPQDLPAPGEWRDRIIQTAFGSPDPYLKQIDGVGGATSTTSKVVIVGPSEHMDCDVDYFFGQVDIGRPLVDYTGSCGNLSAAVGPFAIQEGLVRAVDPVTRVRIWQVNTRKRIIASIPTCGGEPEVDGDFVIDGVPFPGAKIRLEYLDPGGSGAFDFLPTGHAVDVIDIPPIGRVEVSLVDATNPVVFVRAHDLGLTGTELGDEIDGHPEIRRVIETIRAHGAVLMGLAASPEEATARRPGTPKVAFVAPPVTYRTSRGTTVDGTEISLVARIMTMGTLHRTYAVTGGIATAAAALVHGSVVNSVARLTRDEPEQDIRIGHPSGVLWVGARVSHRGDRWACEKAVTFRTARRLMDGGVCIPASVAHAISTAARAR
jgi:2-methylaconitate isomerase